MTILKPHNDTLITMARSVYEKSELNFLPVSFNIREESSENETMIIVHLHDDEKNTSEVYEEVTIGQLVASYIGLNLPLDLDANDAVTKSHRLGKTGR